MNHLKFTCEFDQQEINETQSRVEGVLTAVDSNGDEKTFSQVSGRFQTADLGSRAVATTGLMRLLTNAFLRMEFPAQ